MDSATASSVMFSAASSKYRGMASSESNDHGNALIGHHSWAIRRAAFSVLAQHTVTCAYFGFFLPPFELNVLITGPSSPAVINPSPIRAADSAIWTPPAAT